MAGSLAVAGTGGRVLLQGTPQVPIAGINAYTLVVAAENYDVSVFGDYWKEFIPGLRSWNGTLTGFYEVTTDTTGQAQLYNAILTGLQLVLELELGDGSYFWGLASITDGTVSNPVNNVAGLNWTYVGSGALQRAN